MIKFNGWQIELNKFDGFPATKEILAFHPIYDGHYWEQFDTMKEAEMFCTIEIFEKWHNELV